jgi:hypothetical protein
MNKYLNRTQCEAMGKRRRSGDECKLFTSAAMRLKCSIEAGIFKAPAIICQRTRTRPSLPQPRGHRPILISMISPTDINQHLMPSSPILHRLLRALSSVQARRAQLRCKPGSASFRHRRRVRGKLHQISGPRLEILSRRASPARLTRRRRPSRFLLSCVFRKAQTHRSTTKTT